MLDPQVQIHIIDLAVKWAEKTTVEAHVASSKWYDTIIKNFDKTYKDILKTVQPQNESGGEIPVKHFG